MSGDVQPRKRKDKKRKRDSLDRRSDGDFVFARKHSLQDDEPREQHQGVHGSKMGNEDVHLHVQGEHETGGHWCAKLFFFSLLAILLGLIGLIILENRGLADLDTPLSESRFSNYFDGWVDEHREAHDEHDAVTASIEEHEHGDEPFEEEEDHSEIDEAEDDEDEKGHDDEDEDDGEENEEEDVDTEENEDENEETEEVEAETAEEPDETREDEDNDEENQEDEEVEETREDEDEEADEETNENDDNKDDEDEDDEETTEDIESPQIRTQTASSAQSKTTEEDDDNDEPFEEEEDDGTFESLESVVVDNDAEELLILQEKARQQQASQKKAEPENEEETPSYSSSLAVKIGVGVALALVARLVLIRKNPNTNEPPAEVLMKRRLTIAAPEDTFTEDHDELLEYDVTEEDGVNNLELSGEEEYIEEEIEEEEEIEVTDEEYEEEKIEEQTKYKPQTFEQLNSMYRRQNELLQSTEIPSDTTNKASPPKTLLNEPKAPTTQDYSQREEQLPVASNRPSQSRFAQYRREKTPPSEIPINLPQLTSNLTSSDKIEREEDSHAYSAEHEEDAEYDEEELYDDEMLEEEEEEDDIGDDEEDEEDLSDVDDSELMNRLEAKYGRLPAKEFESDEDVEDQSWTKIKPRSGGPQVMDDDDEFEEELKKANEEMLRENLNSALTLFESLSRIYPDKPEAFLGKAKILDRQSEIHRSNSKLIEALEAYKRYLAFEEDITDDKEFTEIAKRCVDRMRFIGLHLQALPIHEMLIDRFPNEVSHRNQLAVTYLMLNRLSDAKIALEENLARWPDDGFAMVHYGFVLKNLNENLHLAVEYLQRGIDSQKEGTQDGRFYFNLGDSLQRLGRVEEARKVYRRGAASKLFLSEYQRSLYNVDLLRSQPFWSKIETGYENFLNQLEKNWLLIRDEGLRALNAKGAFEKESENLRDSGDWLQLELFARGQRRSKNCLEAPVTCGIIEMFPAARFCKRGQVKFSVMHPGTHIWPHCGPTNCRLRAHLGLKVPPGTLLRVAKEKRTWKEGKFLIFDDSFEHEVWHNGTSPRLVLIVDIWHPDLTEQQRQSLSPI